MMCISNKIVRIENQVLYQYLMSCVLHDSDPRAYSGTERKGETISERNAICGSDGKEYQTDAATGQSDIGFP